MASLLQLVDARSGRSTTPPLDKAGILRYNPNHHEHTIFYES